MISRREWAAWALAGSGSAAGAVTLPAPTVVPTTASTTAPTASPTTAPTTAPVLRFAVGETWAPPYIELKGGQPVGGLMLELMQAIARAAGARAVYVPLPALRVDAALADGEVDLHCLISPQWLAEPPPAARLGPVMVVLEDVLAAMPGTAPVPLEDQPGLRVGTVLGYRYGPLDALFAEGRLVREDAPSQQRMLDKLSRGRTSVAVVDRLVLAHFNRSLPPARRLVVLRSLRQTPTQCLLGTRLPLPTERLQLALNRVLARGEFKRILARYR